MVGNLRIVTFRSRFFFNILHLGWRDIKLAGYPAVSLHFISYYVLYKVQFKAYILNTYAFNSDSQSIIISKYLHVIWRKNVSWIKFIFRYYSFGNIKRHICLNPNAFPFNCTWRADAAAVARVEAVNRGLHVLLRTGAFSFNLKDSIVKLCH